MDTIEHIRSGNVIFPNRLRHAVHRIGHVEAVRVTPMELERVQCETELIDQFDLDLAARLDGFPEWFNTHSTIIVVPADYSGT
jgi:hypothetical protein